MNNIEMDHKTLQQNSVLIPFAVAVGTSIAILAYRSLGSATAMIAILAGVIIISLITYTAVRSR